MKQILDAAALDRAIRRLSHEIEERNDGLRDVALIGIRTRGMVVAERIRDFFRESEGIELPLGVLDITLYRDDILSCDALVKGTENIYSLHTPVPPLYGGERARSEYCGRRFPRSCP